MKPSYGLVDRRKVLLYKPHLFRKTEDILIFPSKELKKWQSDIREYLDGIYQINAKNMGKGRLVDVEDVKLVQGLVVNINEELENIFNPDGKMNFTYNYVSVMDDEYKKPRNNYYGRYMNKIDRKFIKITPRIKYLHMMEIVDYAHKLWSLEDGYARMLKNKAKK